QHAALTQQRFERQHHAVAYEAAHLLAQYPRRDQRQDGLLAADDQRVTGVVAALKACHGDGTLGQEVYDLAFAFITPLGADDDDELSHLRDPPLAHEEQNDDADQHGAQTRDAQLTVAHFEQLGKRALEALGIEKGRDALHHQKQPERGQQVGEVDRHDTRGAPQRRGAGAFGEPASFRYLKNSPSG